VQKITTPSVRRRFAIQLVGYVGALALALACIAMVFPHFSDKDYELENGKKIVIDDTSMISFPYKGKAVVYQKVKLGRLHPTKFTFYVHDCINSLEVNGMRVVLPLRRCDFINGITVSLQDIVHPGENNFRMEIDSPRDFPMVIVSVARFDSLIVVIVGLLLLAWIGIFYRSIKTGAFAKQSALATVIFIGAAVRVFYSIFTPLFARMHDVDGHIEYIFYVLQHWQIPNVNLGWQMYQPPLYYFLTAIVLSPAYFMSRSQTLVLFIMQAGNVLISFLALYVAMKIAWQLFPQPKQSLLRLCLIGIVALLPGIVFLAPMVNNDALMVLWFFCFLWALQAYWAKPTKPLYYACVGILCAALLTKSNSVALVPAFISILLLHPKLPFKRRYVLLEHALQLLVLSVGWYFFYRFVLQGQVHLVGNIQGNNILLFTPNWKPIYLVLIKPIELIFKPYYLPFDATTNRAYFFHVLLTSAYSGEWKFAPPVLWILRVIHVTNLILLPVGMYALFRDWLEKNWTYAPQCVTSLFLLFAMYGLQANKHNSGLQDFRYATLFVIPVAFYVLRGISLLPKRYQKILLGLFGLQLVCLLIYYPVLLKLA
jgi:hypothetical protein